MIKRFAMVGRIAAMIIMAGLLPISLGAEESLKKGRVLDVVELFTSQGCSSCPPADYVLQTYVKRDDVIALSYSVDYWDYLGWRDTFGDAANSKRQRDYARTRGDGSVYTPQAVVNGVSHMNGAHKAKIDREISRTNKILADKLLSLKAEPRGGDISLVVNGDIDAVGQPVTVWMLRVKDKGIVNVKRGENGGRKLMYHNIVLGAKNVATLKSLAAPVSIAQPKKALAKDEHWVFLLQVGLTGPILGAVKI